MAKMTSSLLNGERAVVLLLTIRILFSTPFSLLLLEAVSLSLLVFLALFVEISLEFSGSSCDFHTRLGASSGILLGAVTLPTVMLSKLIQQSRGMSFEEVAFYEFQYQRLLYWATYMCCFIVLMFLGMAIRYSSSSKLVLNFSFMSLILCATVYFMVSANGSTFGEALLVTAGLTTYFGDIFGSTLLKVVRLMVSPEVINAHDSIKRSEISTIIQCYLLGLLLLPLLFKVVIQVADHFISSSAHVERSRKEMFRSVLFFTSLVVGSTIIIPLWLQFVQDFQVHPLFWVVTFVFSEPHKRLSLCIYWIAVICVSVHRFYNISKSSKVERILLRKYYHLMAVSMFVPALILQPSFLNLAFGVALAAFLVFEIIRVWRIWPLGEMIHQFMSAFTDHRDSDLLIVSHFSLLLGCALPMWMSSGFNDRPLAPFAGILSLGIGDTMASMVGHKYGVLRWSKTGKKTIEGTAAGITSVLVSCSFLLPLLASTGYIQNWSSLLIAVIASGLLEAYTTQLDNAFIPLAFYSLLCV